MPRILALIGIVGGVLWLGLAFFRPDWGPPGTTQYPDYELWNRLWTPALLGMGIGFGGFFRLLRPALTRLATGGFIGLLGGGALMILGNVGEFWIFTAMPYEGEGSLIRITAWLTYLFGALLLLGSATVLGGALGRAAHLPLWPARLFIVALPVSIAIMFVNMELAVQVPLIGGLSILAGGVALRSRNRVAPAGRG